MSFDLTPKQVFFIFLPTPTPSFVGSLPLAAVEAITVLVALFSPTCAGCVECVAVTPGVYK